jgi:hypothetical protein
MCSLNFSQLHRRLAQPSAIVRPRCRTAQLFRIPLDLLARSLDGSYARCWVLQVHQGEPLPHVILALLLIPDLQFLEYETVLGPEDDDEKHTANMNQAGGAGASALVGGATTAPGMLGTTGRAPTHTGPTLATQGAGLGDLLTHGNPADDGAHVSTF